MQIYWKPLGFLVTEIEISGWAIPTTNATAATGDMEILRWGRVARGGAAQSELMVLVRPKGCHSQIWKRADDIAAETSQEK